MQEKTRIAIIIHSANEFDEIVFSQCLLVLYLIV